MPLAAGARLGPYEIVSRAGAGGVRSTKARDNRLDPSVAIKVSCADSGQKTATDDGVRVTVLEEPLAIAIEEGTKRVEHRVSFTEQKLIDSGRGWQVPTHDEVPSGRLTLVITNVSHMRHRFTESSKPLEQLLT